jgi:PAS domain S-box-containing protein
MMPARRLARLSVADIHPKEDLPQVYAEFEAQVQGEKALAADLRCLRQDCAVIHVNISGAVAVLDGRTCNVGFFTDITERKRAEVMCSGCLEQQTGYQL